VLWEKILAHRAALTASGEFDERRRRQAVAWMRDMLNDRIMASVQSNPRVAARLPSLEAEVRDGRLLPTLAVDEIMALADIHS
jgi:LAO/AO transport system kinase